MLTKEDVDSWNTLFPDCQITENNLSHPTEHFLTLALVGYLKRFGYNVEPPFSLNVDNKENNRENRLFSIKLARQIDHFLKITDKTYNFTYYDLIRPSKFGFDEAAAGIVTNSFFILFTAPKKTSHMLYILLNYYYHYNQYKEKVFEKAGNRIRRLEDLRAMIDDTRRDNEQRREEAINMKSTIDKLMEELPEARLTQKEMFKKFTLLDEEHIRLNHVQGELKEKLKHLEGQSKDLRKCIVPDKESEDLHKQVQHLKQQLAERKEMEQKNKENLKESQVGKAKLEHLSKEIENALEIIPLHLIEQLNDTNKQLEKVQKEETADVNKHKLIIQQIEEEQQALKSLDQQRLAKKQEFDIKQNNLAKELSAKQNLLKQKNTDILNLEEDEHYLQCHLDEQMDIAYYLKENITDIMATYEN